MADLRDLTNPELLAHSRAMIGRLHNIDPWFRQEAFTELMIVNQELHRRIELMSDVIYDLVDELDLLEPGAVKNPIRTEVA